LTALIAESAGIITTVTGIIAALLGSGHPAVIITGAVLTVLSGVAYCIVEGRLDAQAIRVTGNAVADAADALGGEKAADVIEGVTDTMADVFGVAGEKTVPEDGKDEDGDNDSPQMGRIGF
ncbi:MAG: hypothetical protein J6B24_08400, partial [Clostridia bacterium]|nr:hypothetical protein [Clostridia bacterium]